MAKLGYVHLPCQSQHSRLFLQAITNRQRGNTEPLFGKLYHLRKLSDLCTGESFLDIWLGDRQPHFARSVSQETKCKWSDAAWNTSSGLLRHQELKISITLRKQKQQVEKEELEKRGWTQRSRHAHTSHSSFTNTTTQRNPAIGTQTTSPQAPCLQQRGRHKHWGSTVHAHSLFPSFTLVLHFQQ